MLPVTTMRLLNPKNIGTAYGAITGALVSTVVGSWWCWNSLNVGHHPTETLHDICLAIWVVSGALLALSQIVFIGVAVRLKGGAVATTDVAPGASAGEAPDGGAKFMILVFAVVILVIIAFLVFALSQMPS
jgi:hypothetical protein